MISSLYIDGWALWVAFGIFFILFFGFIYFGSAYIKEKNHSERLERELGLFKREFSYEVSKAYKRGFNTALITKGEKNESKSKKN